MSRYLSLIGRQAGKWTFTKIWKGNEILAALKTGVLTVNPNAQRTLAKGANATPTHQLVDQDKVHDTPRMKELVQFLNRVMDKVEKGDVSEGFLGAVLTIIPEDFHDARWVPLEGVGPEERNRVGYLVVEDAGLDRPAFHVGDGQGRLFGLYSMEFIAKRAVQAKRKEMEKARKAKKDVRQLEKDLAEGEILLKRIQKFIREFQLTVVCYARSVRDDGTVVGLDEKAQKRLFVEGNALNSKAGKEVQLKFDTVSPIGTALYLLRFEQPEFFWMDPDYIEENNKSIAKGSSKLFTLSTLTQAYGWSVANTTKVQSLEPKMYEMVGTRKDFAEAYWRKVTEVFGPAWRRVDTMTDGEWLDYLGQRRTEQNVAFQAVFLQALGRFGYNLGKRAGWDPEAGDWPAHVEVLAPRIEGHSPHGKVDYRAFLGRVGDAGKDGKKEWIQVLTDLAADFNPLWTNALMKPRTGKDAGGKPTTAVVGYVFNNVRDSIVKTYRALLDLAGVPDEAEPAEDSGEPAEETEAEAAV
jgi:hypothetical protein